jgi:solute carrier family 5 (sodium-dependent multivitamin transporter), member 6
MAGNFSVTDYVVFGLILAASAGIGIVSAIINRKKQSTTDHLLGGRKLKVFPVALSILASFTSAIAILGFSSEMYKFGTQYWMIGISYFMTQPIVAIFYAPFFHRLGITSAYEYLELRFDRKVRLVTSMVFCAKMLLYMAVVLYAPSVAIEYVTGLPLYALIIGTGVLCTFYTTLGGMKAGIWIDSLQVLVIYAGLLIIIIMGSIEVGGIDEVWKRAYDGNRIEFFK